jgi:hypothetical protein
LPLVVIFFDYSVLNLLILLVIEGWHWGTVWEDTDVQLQGTSTLFYLMVHYLRVSCHWYACAVNVQNVYNVVELISLFGYRTTEWLTIGWRWISYCLASF